MVKATRFIALATGQLNKKQASLYDRNSGSAESTNHRTLKKKKRIARTREYRSALERIQCGNSCVSYRVHWRIMTIDARQLYLATIQITIIIVPNSLFLSHKTKCIFCIRFVTIFFFIFANSTVELKPRKDDAQRLFYSELDRNFSFSHAKHPFIWFLRHFDEN